MHFETECVMAVQVHSRSLILTPIESAYTVYDFLLVINSNFSSILPRFRGRVLEMKAENSTPPLFHPNFGGVRLGLDCRVLDFEERRPRLITGVITFELTQTIRPRYTSTSQTVRRTDGRLTIAIPRFALHASRGKNRK